MLWFRQNALATRWREEALLLPMEMWRTVAFFRFWEEWWEAQAKKWDEEAVEEGRQKDAELDPKERAEKARNEGAQDVNWDDVLNMRIPAPYKPTIVS